MEKGLLSLRIIVGEKNQPPFPSLPSSFPSMEGWMEGKGSQWGRPAAWRREVKFSIERTVSALFVSRRKASPLRVARSLARPPCFPVNGARGEGEGEREEKEREKRKKRSFCNQDTVHRTCERSRIGHCSWHARFVIAIRRREIELAFEILESLLTAILSSLPRNFRGGRVPSSFALMEALRNRKWWKMRTRASWESKNRSLALKL